LIPWNLETSRSQKNLYLCYSIFAVEKLICLFGKHSIFLSVCLGLWLWHDSHPKGTLIQTPSFDDLIPSIACNMTEVYTWRTSASGFFFKLVKKSLKLVSFSLLASAWKLTYESLNKLSQLKCKFSLSLYNKMYQNNLLKLNSYLKYTD
jgi:hypothetical protein